MGDCCRPPQVYTLSVRSGDTEAGPHLVVLGPGVLATALLLVAPLVPGLAVIFVAVLPQEGHGGLEILVGLQALNIIESDLQGVSFDFCLNYLMILSKVAQMPKPLTAGEISSRRKRDFILLGRAEH